MFCWSGLSSTVTSGCYRQRGQMAELTPWIGIVVRQKMNAPPKSVGQKRRGRPPNPCLPDPVISFRLDCDLDLQLEHWRSLRPKPPSRSRAIRVLLRRALAAEKQREDGPSDQKTEAQSSGA